MKKLTNQQINLIEKKIFFNSNFCIFLLDVMGNINISKNESNRNIYCIDENYQIKWQIVHEEKPSFDRNSFVFIKYEKNKLFATDFLGFTYLVNLENGDTKLISWNK